MRTNRDCENNLSPWIFACGAVSPRHVACSYSGSLCRISSASKVLSPFVPYSLKPAMKGVDPTETDAIGVETVQVALIEYRADLNTTHTGHSLAIRPQKGEVTDQKKNPESPWSNH
jgi:hypothetical protein